MNEAIEIIDYTEENKIHLKKLNYEWLEKYFYIEPNDALQLSNPKEEIIDKGGHIFYVKSGEEIIGTATLLKKSAKVYEVAKMAITADFQGKGIANILMKHCIESARKLQATRLILFSNTKLVPAIRLYKKFGFTEVPLTDFLYARSDIKMELVL